MVIIPSIVLSAKLFVLIFLPRPHYISILVNSDFARFLRIFIDDRKEPISFYILLFLLNNIFIVFAKYTSHKAEIYR